jgi:hypothetical protein
MNTIFSTNPMISKYFKTLTTFAIALLLVSACGSGENVGELVKASTSEYMTDKFEKNKDNEGRRISVDGYLHHNTVGTFRYKINQKVLFHLHTEANGKGDSLLSFPVRISGLKNNSISLVSGGTIADAKFTDNSGAAHPLVKKVRVSGTIKYVDMRPVELRIPGTNQIEKRYAYDLEAVRFDRIEK